MTRGSRIFWSVFVAAAVFRIAASFYSSPIDALACTRNVVQTYGYLVQDPEIKESSQIAVIRSGDIYLKEYGGEICATDILIKIKTKLYPRYAYGDRIFIEGKLSKPLNFSSGSGRSFDYEGYLAKDDIYYEIRNATITSFRDSIQGKISSTSNIYSTVKYDVSWLSSLLFAFKRQFVNNLQYSLGEPHSSLAAGLVVGEKSSLGKDILNDFRVVGLIHIIVLSGFNITIVAVALRKVLSFLPRVWGIVIGGIGIVLFGILVGGGATVIRSCFMASIALSADLIRRDYNVFRALGFAALIMLIQNPMILLHDPSFQLSFLATLGLIILAKPIEDKLLFITDKFGIRGVIATSFSTQIFVSPYILWMMGQISIIGIVVNILVLPVIPVTMLFVFLTGSLGFVSSHVSTALGWVTHLLLTYILSLVEYFARIPYASISIPPFPFWVVIFWYVIFFSIYWRFSKRKKI